MWRCSVPEAPGPGKAGVRRWSCDPWRSQRRRANGRSEPDARAPSVLRASGPGMRACPALVPWLRRRAPGGVRRLGSGLRGCAGRPVRLGLRPTCAVRCLRSGPCRHDRGRSHLRRGDVRQRSDRPAAFRSRAEMPGACPAFSGVGQRWVRLTVNTRPSTGLQRLRRGTTRRVRRRCAGATRICESETADAGAVGAIVATGRSRAATERPLRENPSTVAIATSTTIRTPRSVPTRWNSAFMW